MARAAEDPATVSFDDTKLAEVGEVTEWSDEFVALKISEETKAAVPFLKQVNAYLVKEHSGAQHIVVHRASQRSFALAFGSEDLVGFGFTARDTIADCLAILKDAYEASDAVEAVDVKSKMIKRALSISWMKFSDRRDDSVEGEMVASAAAVMPPSTVPTAAETFEECNALRVVVSEDIGRVLPFEYVLLLCEGKQSAAVKDKCTIQRMANEIEEYKAKAAKFEAHLLTCDRTFSFRYRTPMDAGPGILDWYFICDYYGLNQGNCVQLTDNCTVFHIKANGVYKLSLSIWADEVKVYVGSQYKRVHCLYDANGEAICKHEFTRRLSVGTGISFRTTGFYRMHKGKRNDVTICKL